MWNTSLRWRFAVAILILVGVAASQSSHKTRSLVVNGHHGDAIIYEIDGKSFVDLETLVRIANGSMSFRGEQVVLILPHASEDARISPENSHPPSVGFSHTFMRESVQALAAMKDWANTLAHAATRGIPGDGSRLAVFHNRAADALRLSKVAASSAPDQNALHLLTNQFNAVSSWNDKLIRERRSMDTGKYSMSETALSSDETYQKISNCSKFLDSMIPSGHFQDDYSCH